MEMLGRNDKKERSEAPAGCVLEELKKKRTEIVQELEKGNSKDQY